MRRHPRKGLSAAVRWFFKLSIAVIAATTLAHAPGAAQDAVAESGLFLTVPNPITSEVTNRLKESIDRAVREKHVQKIVLDFNPDGKEASSRDFGPCSDLADYLAQVPQVMKIAFVHNKTTRHTVLPVLACDELVMSPEASLGDVLPDHAGPPSKRVQQTYADLAGRAREALVLKMLDRDVVVMAGRRNNADFYFDDRHRAEAERDGVTAIGPQPVVAAGSLALYSAEDARRFNLCKAFRNSRNEVAELYQLPASALREDPLQGRTPDVWKVDVRGPVNKALEETLRRRIDRAVRRGANMVVLQLEASGGSFEVARDLADYLRALRSPEGLPIVTVAFIPQEAPDTATFLAFGCTEIVMGKDATLGNFATLVRPMPAPQPQFPPQPAPQFRRGRAQRPQPQPQAPVANPDLVRDSLLDLAEKQGFSPLLIRGLFDLDLEVFEVRSLKGTPERKFITRAELDEDQRGADKRWGQARPVKAAGQLLELTAAKAKDFGIARDVVNNPHNVQELAALYGVSKIQESPPDWLDRLAYFLGDPVVAMFLIIIGVTCLILELKMPGIGIPGVIAALCFVLFFWSQSQMNGQVTLLAVLLFLLGLVLLGIEIFLVPGFGVIGISGILLVLAGLGLATVEHMPQTSQEWANFGGTLTTFGLGLMIATAAAFVVARYLPNIPYANRLVLAPPGEKEGEAEDDTAAANSDSLAALLGAVGTAATVLRPAGMARIGDAYVDVVSEGSYIPAGARVQVIEIEGNRIVVKEV
jgi:membrane-bound ClpP family serine protease